MGGVDGVARRQKVGILIIIRVGADLCYFDADSGVIAAEGGLQSPWPWGGKCLLLLSTKWNLALISLTPSALD